MVIFKRINDLQSYLNVQKAAGKTIGFVPTMGALHKGHLALINRCCQLSDFSVCSIFVNPTQFNDPSDFNKYPVTIENDIFLLEKQGCNVLFLPSVNEMYPDGVVLKKQYELGDIENLLEGKFRPGHFQGVCQVVNRLLDIVQPDKFFIGQKDYQQCMVVKKMIELVGMENLKLVIVETVRESSGLAFSSRNTRLSEQERNKAIILSEVLQNIKGNISFQSLPFLQEQAVQQLYDNGFEKIDYVEIANAHTLQPVLEWDGKEKLVGLIAAYLHGVRLIDNMILN